jgi:hypothetical protein
MEQFQLQVFLNIIGISTASGILYHDENLYLIADNSTYLYEYNLKINSLNKIPLSENPQENIEKKEKLDYECITKKGNKLYILGSGSTDNRKILTTYYLKKREYINKDLSNTFDTIMKTGNISKDDLNIEGLIMTANELYFFQRGNGKTGKNGIFYINELKDEKKFVSIELPKIKHVNATFTDAVLVGENIYFLAAAEDTTSTYLDGEVLGTLIGKINVTTFEVLETQLISEKNKFEGISFYEETGNEITFLLSEDNDATDGNTNIYKLSIKK